MIKGGRAIGLMLSIFALLAASGCGGEAPSANGRGLADLEVSWTIEGSTSPRYCTELAIDVWLVEVRGPEDFEIFVDCQDQWTTFSALYGLPEGPYTVHIAAFAPAGIGITGYAAPIDLIDTGTVDVVDYQFSLISFF